MDRLIFCHTQLNAWVANFRDCELWYSSKLLNFSSFVARKLPLTYLVIIVTLRSQTFLFRNIYCWKISYVRYVRIAQQINRYTRTVSLKFPGIATHCHCLSGRLHLQISGHPNVWTSSFINGSLRDHADQPWELFLFQFTLMFTVHHISDTHVLHNRSIATLARLVWNFQELLHRDIVTVCQDVYIYRYLVIRISEHRHL